MLYVVLKTAILTPKFLDIFVSFIQIHYMFPSMTKNGEYQFMMMQSYLNCLFYQKHWVNSAGQPFLANETLSGILISHVPVVFLSYRNIVSLCLMKIAFTGSFWQEAV